MITSNIPQGWKITLKKIQGPFPGSIIAGGALRDLLHAKPAKDIDIFVPLDCTGKDWNDVIDAIGVRLIDMFGDTHTVTLTASSIYGKSNLQRNIVCVYRVENKRNHDFLNGIIYETPFEIIVQDTIGGIDINQFDLSLCQIGYNGEYTYVSSAFAETLLTKVVKVMHVNREDRQEKRLNRVLKKYPEYTRGE